MALAVGSHLGRYEILGLLGAGGMGEVYRARDTRLDRIVAIKVLQLHLAGDDRLRQRFEREARAVSNLSHPNICSLYDVGEQDGVDFLVLEHLEGETLRDRLARGPLPTEQALAHAAAMADALEAAHRSGVVHRDLKPANILLTKAGPKLLDFGLAALRERVAPAGNDRLSQRPTEPDGGPLTMEGTLLGTLPYMAPEQVEGKDTDGRTDLFALGSILFEMVTGRMAFQGASSAARIASILGRDPPPVSTLRPEVPPALDRVVARCLAKDPEARWQSARDLALELRWIVETGPGPAVDAGRAREGMRRERWFWMVATSLLAFTAAWLAVGLVPPRHRELRMARLSVLPPVPGSTISDLSVSPDGRSIAMVVWSSHGTQLWVRPLDSLAATPLPGTEGAFGRPFWSPDGRQLGFFAAEGRLFTITLAGGAPRVVCAVPQAPSGTWNGEGTILIGGSVAPLQRVPASGGRPIPIEREAQGSHLPSFLPDGRHFLYLHREEGRSAILAGSLDSDRSTKLLDAESEGVYAPPGYLLFVRGGTLLAQPFDAERLRLSGEAVPLAERVAYADFGRFAFSISNAGVLIFASENPESRLVWLDRSGRELGQVGEPGDYLHVDLSPDGTRAALECGDPFGEDGEHDIWLMDLVHGTRSRFTFDPDFEGFPVWSPDGSHVIYLARRGGKYGLYRKAASGVGQEELLLPAPEKCYPTSFSPGGRSLVFESSWGSAGPPDLWILNLAGAREATPFERTPTWENSGMISPDGRWIAYNQRNDVYVQSFPTPRGKWQLAAGAGFVRWRRDGRELFYGSTSGGLVAVDVQPGAAFRTGTPRPLFAAPSVRIYKNRFPYAVTSDGQRFLVNELAPSPSPVTVVLDWAAGLKR